MQVEAETFEYCIGLNLLHPLIISLDDVSPVSLYTAVVLW